MRARKGHFLILKSDYTNIVGIMALETTFGHWKEVFSLGKMRKIPFLKNSQ